MNDKLKPELMKLLGITDEKVADKVLHYARLVNDGTTTMLVNTDHKKEAQNLLDSLRANNLAVAKSLNERAVQIISMVANAYQSSGFEAIGLDTNQLNKSYVLIVNELEKMYARNEELAGISENPAWKYFDIIQGSEWNINEYIYQNQNDAGKNHIAQINKLCIIAGTETPKFTQAIKTIIDEADEAISKYKTQLDEEKQKTRTIIKNWYISEYKVTYSLDGTILINDVLKVKKLHAGSAPDKLMEQAMQNSGKVFKPDLGQTARNLSTTLSSMGFSGTLRSLFFPSVSKDKGILFRSTVSHVTVDAERIDIADLDTKLKGLGANTEHKPTEIPF